MRQAEPPAQLLGCLVWRPSVERHQRAGPAGDLGNLRAPFIEADGRDFDAVIATVDGLFEEMHDRGVSEAHDSVCCGNRGAF